MNDGETLPALEKTWASAPRTSDIRLSRFETTAIATKLFHRVGKELELKQRFLRVYAKREGQWRCVATQIVAISDTLL